MIYLHAKYQINIFRNKKVIKLLELWTLWKRKKRKENSKYKRVVITKNSEYNRVVNTTLKRETNIKTLEHQIGQIPSTTFSSCQIGIMKHVRTFCFAAIKGRNWKHSLGFDVTMHSLHIESNL